MPSLRRSSLAYAPHPLLTPERIAPGHAANQLAKFQRNRGPSGTRLVAPQEASPCPVPADDGLWTNDDQTGAPVAPPRQPRQAHPRRANEASGLHPALLVEGSWRRRTRFSAAIACLGRIASRTKATRSASNNRTIRAKPSAAGASSTRGLRSHYCGLQRARSAAACLLGRPRGIGGSHCRSARVCFARLSHYVDFTVSARRARAAAASPRAWL